MSEFDPIFDKERRRFMVPKTVIEEIDKLNRDEIEELYHILEETLEQLDSDEDDEEANDVDDEEDEDDEVEIEEEVDIDTKDL